MLNFRDLKIEPVPVEVAGQLVSRHHYSRVMPKLTQVCYGGVIGTNLVAVVTFGWGVRPIHTIKKLFPELTTVDYWEIGKMCLVGDLPRNSESYFLSRVLDRIRQEYPEKRLIYTWADGMVGKPGYVYQATNFLYGGYIWTDCYFTTGGEKIHPRTSKAIMRLNPDKERKARPSKLQLRLAGILHYKGKQFRYLMPLVKGKKVDELLQSSTVEWTRHYPKEEELAWKVLRQDGKWVESDAPVFNNTSYKFNKVKEMSGGVQGVML